MISKKFEQLLVDANISPEMKMSIEGALKGLKGEELETFCELPEFRKALEDLFEAIAIFDRLMNQDADNIGNLKKIPGAVFRVTRAMGALRSAGKKARKIEAQAIKAASKLLKLQKADKATKKAAKAAVKERKRAMKARIKEAKAAAAAWLKAARKPDSALRAEIKAEVADRKRAYKARNR